KNEEDTPITSQIVKFIKRFLPFWLVPVTMHFLWNSSSVWIFLYLYLTNNLNEVLYLILEIIVIVCLSVMCFLLLLLFLRKANKVAKNTYRCPETGIIVSKEGLICEAITDSFSSESAKSSIESDTKIQHVKFCPTCGVQVNINQNFCTNCGTSFAFLKRRFSIIRHRRDGRLYNSATKQLIIISIVFSNIFLIFTIGVFVLVALMIGIYSLYYFFALIIFELISGLLLLYASIKLLILRKKYNGSKNVFYWLIIIVNSIGMFGMFLLTGISFIFLGSLILLGVGILFIVGSAVILVFLIRGLLKGNQIMQYQREI
ncbi:MAG TPA: zinc-ribbon domain-containing protein, partial [Candidatus Lokiarchaeia archaeon]